MSCSDRDCRVESPHTRSTRLRYFSNDRDQQGVWSLGASRLQQQQSRHRRCSGGRGDQLLRRRRQQRRRQGRLCGPVVRGGRGVCRCGARRVDRIRVDLRRSREWCAELRGTVRDGCSAWQRRVDRGSGGVHRVHLRRCLEQHLSRGRRCRDGAAVCMGGSRRRVHVVGDDRGGRLHRNASLPASRRCPLRVRLVRRTNRRGRVPGRFRIHRTPRILRIRRRRTCVCRLYVRCCSWWCVCVRRWRCLWFGSRRDPDDVLLRSVTASGRISDAMSASWLCT
jgi:hypothetical protein